MEATPCDDSALASVGHGRRGPRRKRTAHSRSGCATCRKRRVRCDEDGDICGNCTRLGLSCSWYRPAELAQRSRVNTACERCQRKKIKCTSTWSTGPCDPCQSTGIACVNAKGRRKSTATISNGSPTIPTASEGPASPHRDARSALSDRDEVCRLVEAYFKGPHYYCFYTFIHQPTFMQMLQDDAVPQSLLLMVIATSLHYLEPYNYVPDLWADECRRLVMAEIFSPPSATTLQALLLLQRYEWHRASHINAWFLSGLAVKLAHGLQLHIEISDEARVPATVRETRRRLTWSCFIMESMIEAGRNPLCGINASTIEVNVPCSEKSFQLGLEADMPSLGHLLSNRLDVQQNSLSSTSNASASASTPGISAFLVKLTALRRDIIDYTLPYHPRNKGHIPSAIPWAHDAPFFDYEAKLEQWCACLPEELQFKPEVMYRRRSQLVSLITLHCLFHGCYCDLYRIGSYVTASYRSGASGGSLPVASQSFLATCRRGRLRHAFAICKVISDSMEYHSIGHDPVVGIGAALAMRVLVIERQQEDSETLGLTDNAVFTCLDAAVRCAKEIAKRSVPIRELFCSVCSLAKQHGYEVDLSEISTGERLGSGDSVAGLPSTVKDLTQERERAPSPSLRTYGTFGSIQNSLAKRKDVLAAPASSSSEKESDLFSNFGPSRTNRHLTQHSEPPANSAVVAMSDPSWDLDSAFLSYESLSPGYMANASGWGDGTLNFSMMPSQFDWINQSLGFGFEGSGAYDFYRDDYNLNS